MAVPNRTYFDIPVHPGAHQAALAAYRTVGAPDDSALPEAKRLEAFLAVFNAVHGMTKAGPETALADAARLWDSALTGQQKRMIAASPGAAPMIVADAIKQDQTLAQKARAPAQDFGVDIKPGDDSFFDPRGLNRLQKLGIGSAAAAFRKDYGSISGEWDPNTGGRGLTSANFASTEFSRVGLDLATTQHLFGLGFGATNILNAAKSADFLGIGTLNKKGMQHLAAVDKHDPEKEKTLTLAKAYTDALARDNEYQALRRRYLAASGAERKALDEQMQEIEKRHGHATGYQRHVEAAPSGKVRETRMGVQESINEVQRFDEGQQRAYGIVAGATAAAARNPYAAPGNSAPRAVEKIIENYQRDKDNPVARRAYQELKAAMRTREQRAALDKIEREFAQRKKADTRITGENEQKAIRNEQRTARNEVQQEKVVARNAEGDDLLAAITGSAVEQPQQRTAVAPATKIEAKDNSRVRGPAGPTGLG